MKQKSRSRYRKVLLLLCFGFKFFFSYSAYAAETEKNVIIRLDLSHYDSFSETINVNCIGDNGDEMQDTLTQYNNYENAYYLPTGRYQISLSVQGDTLNLIDLMPMSFEVYATEDEIQTYIIKVQDAAGMEANEGSHEGMEYEEESAPRAIEAEQYTFTETEEEAGTLLITGPDVTGLESLSYTLQSQEGKDIICQLKKEYHFRAELKVPYGRYKEMLGPVEVIANEDINIPEDAEFYLKYYGSKFSNLLVVTEESRNATNADNLQLWVRRSSGADYRVRNMYQFAGDEVMRAEGEYQIIGHETEPELEETEHDTASVIRESESEIQNETSSPEEKRLFGINIVLTAAIIIVLFGLLWYGRGNEK